MKYVKLGNTGIEISQIGFGTIKFNDSSKISDYNELLQTVKAQEINFIDTADGYGLGIAESTIGNWMTKNKNREEMIISSKFVWPTGKSVNEKGWSRKHMRHALKSSLDRLNTNYLDLYIPHGLRPDANLKEILHGLNHEQYQGSILYPAAFVMTSWKLVEAHWLADKFGWDSFQAFLHPYSLVARGAIENDFKNVLNSYKIPHIAFVTQGAGFLAGKWPNENSFSDHPNIQFVKKTYGTKEGWALLETLIELGKNHDATSGQIAIKWVLEQKEVNSIIVGGTKPEHIEQACRAPEINLQKSELKILDEQSKAFLKRQFELG
jgi:aryl-alcohol dehydrogenase-like predicted oxidoreductase